MRVVVCLLQPLDGDVRINLRRRKTGVAEQRLHAAQVSAGIENMGGKAVPQLVRTDRDRDGCVAQVSLQRQPDGIAARCACALC